MKKRTLVLISILVVIAAVMIVIVLRDKPSKTDKTLSRRPQEPTKPYAYYSEEVTFQNSGANITLSGTLTLPSKEERYPAVILISGSGPQNRDQELLGHKPFLIISDYLTQKGISVLRYDDRGFGQSTGDYSTATALDFATDVESAVAYLKTRKEINPNKIGLIGHSEGGIVVPMVAARSKDVAFMVLLSGPGIQGDSLMMRQQEVMQSALGISEAEIQKVTKLNAQLLAITSQSNDSQALKKQLRKHSQENFAQIPTYFKPENVTKEQFVAAQIEMISSPSYQYSLKYNPAPVLEKVSCPVLALNGEKDLQVPPKENLTAIRNALGKGGNKNILTKELPNLNHFFQECETGLPTEYATIEQTFSPAALAEISNWILKQVK